LELGRPIARLPPSAYQPARFPEQNGDVRALSTQFLGVHSLLTSFAT